MNRLTVPYMSLEKFLACQNPYYLIDKDPWQTKKQPCFAGFKIAHCGDRLFIKYQISERFLNVKKRAVNGLVNKDNCVEFFFAFEGETNYYNFEVNCLGSIKAAYGAGRKQRKSLPAWLLKNIESDIAIAINNSGPGQLICWELCITLKATDFCFHNRTSLNGLAGHVNFTKCGDGLPEPHYLSWVDLFSSTPDFHQPGSFGKLQFEPNHLRHEETI